MRVSTTKKQRNADSARRWKKYAAAAVGAIAAGAAADRANAAIMYFNPDDVSTSPEVPLIYFDADNSSGAAPGDVNGLVQTEATTYVSSLNFPADTDFGLSGPVDGFFGYYDNARLNARSGNGIADGSSNFPNLFAFGDTISDDWTNWATNARFEGSIQPSPWAEGTVTGFVGLRFFNGGGTADDQYGWARVTYNSDTNVVTLHDFAVETQLGVGILAGAGAPTEIPEPSSLLLAALGGAGLLALRRRRKAAAVTK